MNQATLKEILTNEPGKSRLQAAYQRYGWRAFIVAFYRLLFQVPLHLRSTLFVWKVKCLLDSDVGANVSFGKDIFLSIPGGRVEIGDNTIFSDRCVVVVSANPKAKISIGANCFFARDVHFCSYQEISIGNNVRIAEFSSLHDSPHSYKDKDRPINQQGDIQGKIIIKDDVWIGQGSILLGSPDDLVIGQGAIIGAHSVVKDSIPDFAIAVGSPARIIKYRE